MKAEIHMKCHCRCVMCLQFVTLTPGKVTADEA